MCPFPTNPSLFKATTANHGLKHPYAQQPDINTHTNDHNMHRESERTHKAQIDISRCQEVVVSRVPLSHTPPTTPGWVKDDNKLNKRPRNAEEKKKKEKLKARIHRPTSPKAKEIKKKKKRTTPLLPSRCQCADEAPLSLQPESGLSHVPHSITYILKTPTILPINNEKFHRALLYGLGLGPIICLLPLPNPIPEPTLFWLSPPVNPYWLTFQLAPGLDPALASRGDS